MGILILVQATALSLTAWQDIQAGNSLTSNGQSPFSTDWIFYVVIDIVLAAMVFIGHFTFFSVDVYRLNMANSIIQIFVVVLFAISTDLTAMAFCIAAGVFRAVMQFMIYRNVGNSPDIEQTSSHFFMRVFENYFLWSILVLILAAARMVADSGASVEARGVYSVAAAVISAFLPLAISALIPSGVFYALHVAYLIDVWYNGAWPANINVILWVIVSVDLLVFIFNLGYYAKLRFAYDPTKINWREHFVSQTFVLTEPMHPFIEKAFLGEEPTGSPDSRGKSLPTNFVTQLFKPPSVKRE
jgi:hypothetical protein